MSIFADALDFEQSTVRAEAFKPPTFVSGRLSLVQAFRFMPPG
jgi:hypothetical protein